jgi:hypothetical protein
MAQGKLPEVSRVTPLKVSDPVPLATSVSSAPHRLASPPIGASNASGAGVNLPPVGDVDDVLIRNQRVSSPAALLPPPCPADRSGEVDLNGFQAVKNASDPVSLSNPLSLRQSALPVASGVVVIGVNDSKRDKSVASTPATRTWGQTIRQGFWDAAPNTFLGAASIAVAAVVNPASTLAKAAVIAGPSVATTVGRALYAGYRYFRPIVPSSGDADVALLGSQSSQPALTSSQSIGGSAITAVGAMASGAALTMARSTPAGAIAATVAAAAGDAYLRPVMRR